MSPTCSSSWGLTTQWELSHWSATCSLPSPTGALDRSCGCHWRHWTVPPRRSQTSSLHLWDSPPTLWCLRTRTENKITAVCSTGIPTLLWIYHWSWQKKVQINWQTSADTFRIWPQKVTHGSIVGNFLFSVNGPDLVQRLDGRRQTTVHAEDLKNRRANKLGWSDGLLEISKTLYRVNV